MRHSQDTARHRHHQVWGREMYQQEYIRLAMRHLQDRGHHLVTEQVQEANRRFQLHTLATVPMME